MWKASLYSPHFPLDLIEDMTPWTSCIGEHFPTSVSFLIFLARPMILAKIMLWNRLTLSNMHSAYKCFKHARWMLHMTRMNLVQRQDTGQQLSGASALGPWWTWCAVTSHSASASSARRRGSSWRDEHSGHDCPEPFPCGRHQQTGRPSYTKRALELSC